MWLLRLHSARESAATEPYSRTPYGWLLRAQLSREAPPPLPGGYKPGEKVGDKLVHGQQGKVVGPATLERHKGKGVAVLFSGNKDRVPLFLTEVRRRRADPAAPAAPNPTPPLFPSRLRWSGARPILTRSGFV